jgi:hypothetical protein
MYNFYNMSTEKRPAWKNAYEIKMAALEHEKMRFKMMNEETSFLNSNAKGKGRQQLGWKAFLKKPLHLLLNMIG